MTDSDRLQRLADIVRCVRCRAAAGVHPVPDGLRCVSCNAIYSLSNGVLQMEDAAERPEVLAEREGVVQTEHVAALGGINETFDDLAKAEGALKEAILALPEGNDSRYYREPGYFLNVKNSLRGFRFVRDRLDVVPGQRLLDVGADLTWSTNFFARQGLVCTAIDVNHHLAVGNIFQARYGAPYDMVRADMCSPAFRQNSFDLIVAFNALHHGGDLDRLATTLVHTLKPGGRLAAVEPYCISLEQKELFGRAQSDAGINEHTYMLDEWHAALSRAGLALVEVLVADACSMIYRRPSPGENTSLQTTMLQHAYHGQLTVRSIEPSPVPRQLIAHVDIHNRGNATWCSEGSLPIFASYHLSRRVGEHVSLIAHDNRRTAIPDVAPASTISCSIVVDLPAEAGTYELTFDLVQEGLCWFAEKGFVGETSSTPA